MAIRHREGDYSATNAGFEGDRDAGGGGTEHNNEGTDYSSGDDKYSPNDEANGGEIGPDGYISQQTYFADEIIPIPEEESTVSGRIFNLAWFKLSHSCCV